MEKSIKDRLLTFLDFKNISKKRFCETINVSLGYVNSMRKSPSSDVLCSIAAHFPDLNIDWLLIGRGEMLLQNESSEKRIEELQRIISLQNDLIALLKKDK